MYFTSLFLCLWPSAVGHESVCGHWLRHSACQTSEKGYFRPRSWHHRCYQAVQQVCETCVWTVHWTHSPGCRYCGSKRWRAHLTVWPDLSFLTFQPLLFNASFLGWGFLMRLNALGNLVSKLLIHFFTDWPAVMSDWRGEAKCRALTTSNTFSSSKYLHHKQF